MKTRTPKSKPTDPQLTGSDRHSLQLLKQDLRRIKRMSDDELRAALRAGKRDEVVERFAGFARWAAIQFRPGGLDDAEAISVAFVELLKVVDALLARPKLPPSPKHYILKAIKRALLRAMAQDRGPFTLDYSTRHQLLKAQHQLHAERISAGPEADHSSTFTIDALAKRAGVGLETAKRFELAWHSLGTRLSAPIVDDHGRSMDETADSVVQQSTFEAPDAAVLRWDNERLVRKILKEAKPPLTANEEVVLILRFGLADGVEHTLAEIAAILNLSIFRTEQLSSSALNKLRATLSEPAIKNLFDSAMWKLRNGTVKRAS
jgi:DNA-directed RNA polymerase specialized sigma subunit